MLPCHSVLLPRSSLSRYFVLFFSLSSHLPHTHTHTHTQQATLRVHPILLCCSRMQFSSGPLTFPAFSNNPTLGEQGGESGRIPCLSRDNTLRLRCFDAVLRLSLLSSPHKKNNNKINTTQSLKQRRSATCIPGVFSWFTLLASASLLPDTLWLSRAFVLQMFSLFVPFTSHPPDTLRFENRLLSFVLKVRLQKRKRNKYKEQTQQHTHPPTHPHTHTQKQ